MKKVADSTSDQVKLLCWRLGSRVITASPPKTPGQELSPKLVPIVLDLR